MIFYNANDVTKTLSIPRSGAAAKDHQSRLSLAPLSFLRPPQHRPHALRAIGLPSLVEQPGLGQLRRDPAQRQTTSAQPFGQLHGFRCSLAEWLPATGAGQHGPFRELGHQALPIGRR